MKEIFIAVLWSISPFGEAKVGLPYALFNGGDIYISYAACLIANILVFPLMFYFLNCLNHYFFKLRFYKKAAIYVGRRAKTGVGKNIQKYGFWGLLFFVMIPLPGTGVYAGTIAAYLFRIDKQSAFFANSIGIFISTTIIWGISLLTIQAMN